MVAEGNPKQPRMGNIPANPAKTGQVIPHGCPYPCFCRDYYQDYYRPRDNPTVGAGVWHCVGCNHQVLPNVPIGEGEGGKTFTKEESNKIRFLQSLRLDKRGRLVKRSKRRT